MKLIHEKKISLFIVFTLFSIILFGPFISAALNINLEDDDGFDRNVTITSTSTGYIPYVGAITNVDLGVYDLTADWIFAKLNWSYLQNIPVGYIAKRGGSPYLYNDSTTIYFNDTFGNNTYVPYTGATKDVDIGVYDFYANATYFTGNVSVSVPSSDAEFRLDSGTNMDSCFILQESDSLGFNFCYDGSGTNRWVVRNNNGTIWFEIERDNGNARFYNSTTIDSNLTVGDYIIGDGSYITNLNLTSVNDSFVPYTGATGNVDLGVNNITAYMGNFTDLYVSNATLYIGNVSISTNDSATKSLTLEAGAEMVATRFVGDGSQLTNISFVNGSATFNGSVTAESFVGGNFTGDNFTGLNFFGGNFFGDILNIIGISNFSGPINLLGDARVEKELIFKASSATKGAAAPADVLRDIGASGGIKEPLVEFSKVTDQEIFGTFHAPFDIDNSTNISFHLMWIPGEAWTSGSYNWTLEYLIKKEDVAYGDANSSSGTPIIIGMNVTPSNFDEFIETEFTKTINMNADEVLNAHFYRDVSGDNGDDVGQVRFFEVEYTLNKLGKAI